MARARWIRLTGRVFRGLLIAYALLLVAVFCGQRSLLYHPTKASETTLLAEAGKRGAVPWRNAKGDLIGWKKAAAGSGTRERVLILHGNAGYALDRIPYADTLRALTPGEVYVLEYPGYGGRPGSPSQSSILTAAAEALAILRQDGPVSLMGESLGTGVAAYLAGANPEAVSGVLLVTPYHNLTEVGQHQMPIIPVSLMLRDRYPAAQFLETYHGPVAVVLAGEDKVIPKQFGRKLEDAYAGPKRRWEVPGASHNDVLPRMPPGWWEEIAAFLKAPRVRPPHSLRTPDHAP